MPDIADRAIATMRSPKDMHIICVDITNRCDLRCSNCTRLLVNQAHHWDMSPDNFRTALRSLDGYTGVIAMIGGNPCLHKQFTEICGIFAEEVPNKRQRGLWSNNVFNHQDLIAETFGFFNLNPHNDPRGKQSLEKLRAVIPGLSFYQGNSTHAPLLTAVRDLIPDEQTMWDTIAGCDINRNWSASIVENKGELRAYFCEVAASFDLARGTDHGAPVVPGWWRRAIGDFSDQVKRFCPGCGVPARLKGQQDADEIDEYSASNADIALAARGRRKAVLVDRIDTVEAAARAVTDYNEAHRAKTSEPERDIAVSVVIPCYNAAETIEETIASVLAQRQPGGIGVEIVVSDDGSTDGTQRLVEAMAIQNPGVIRFLRGPTGNTGAAAARNRGLRAVSGPFVCFLDSDDCYEPRFFPAALAVFANAPSAAAVTTGVAPFNSHRALLPIHLNAMRESLPSNLMVRRSVAEALGGFPEGAVYRGKAAGEDVAFRRALERYFLTIHLAEPFFRYRVKKGSHFDNFLDSTEVVDGALVTVRLSQEQADGSLDAAATAYQLAIGQRLREIEQCRRPDPAKTPDLSMLAEFEAFRGRLWSLADISPADAFHFRHLAANGPGRGHIAVARQVGEIVRRALEDGTSAAGRLAAVNLDDIAAGIPVRLLVIDATQAAGAWEAALDRGLPLLGQEGCLAVYHAEANGMVDAIRRRLESAGGAWRENRWTDRIRVYTRI